LSAIFLDKLNSPVIPGTSCFYGNWVEDVHAGQFIIFGDFVGCCLVRRCTCLIIIIIIIKYYTYVVISVVFVGLVVRSSLAERQRALKSQKLMNYIPNDCQSQ